MTNPKSLNIPDYFLCILPYFLFEYELFHIKAPVSSHTTSQQTLKNRHLAQNRHNGGIYLSLRPSIK